MLCNLFIPFLTCNEAIIIPDWISFIVKSFDLQKYYFPVLMGIAGEDDFFIALIGRERLFETIRNSAVFIVHCKSFNIFYFIRYKYY